MKLEFSKKTIAEILAEFEDKKTLDWQNDIFDFLKNYENNTSTINFLYQRKDNLYKSVFKREFSNATFQSLNNFLGLKKGDTALLSSSVLDNDGKISLVQAIEGKLDLYCSDNLDEVKIPYTGDEQNEIGFAIDYAFLNEKQLENANSELVRIKKIALSGESIPASLKELVKPTFYNIYIVNGFPIGVKKADELNFTVLDKVDISEDEKNYLVLDSIYEDESLNVERQVYITDENKFRFLSNGEYRMGKNRDLINFELIEKKLEKYIDLNFSVLGFPDKNTGEEVVTLVIESRFIEEINIPKEELESHEVPLQTFYIGEFPKNSEKAAIRAELKQLLSEANS